MKALICAVTLLFLTNICFSQHIYPIRADSVRIYSNCDTAELIIENRTKDTLGFLYNKGKGRTEFRKLQLQTIGSTAIAITGQDTLQLGTIIKTAVDTIYQLNGTLYYRKTNGVVVSLPISTTETLYSVTNRASTTVQNISFNAASANPSNGVAWAYNTDTWKIFVESLQDSPSGNMILESGDNDDEGWIFRSSTSAAKSDVLSLSKNRFLYNGNTVYHSGNFAVSGYVKGGVFDTNPDFNSLVGSGFMGSTNSVTNAPVTGELWWNLITSRHRNGLIDGNTYGMQIAGGMTNFPNRMFFRSQVAGTWTGWKEFWHSGNVTFATKGNDIALKTEADGTLGVENWIRTGNSMGLYTPDGARLYRNNAQSWALRSNTAASWLELQASDGVNRGGFYCDGASGNLGIVNAAANGWRMRIDASSNMYVTGQVYATAFYQNSLRSLKRDIKPFEGQALKILNGTSVRTFIYKADNANVKHIGFIADEIPEEMAAPGHQGVDEANTVALLVKALQEMSAKVEALERKVELLEKK
jgi:hypothetical protein